MPDKKSKLFKNNKSVFRMSLNNKKNIHGYVFILPFLIGLFFFFLPFVYESFTNSFNSVRLTFNNIEREFIGFRNFTDAFLVDVQYRVILLNTVRGMVLDTIIIVFFSFFISNILNQKFRGRGLARTLFFLPVIVSTGIIATADVIAFAGLENAVSNAGNAIQGAFGGGISQFFDLESMLLSININNTLVNVIVYAISNTYNIVNYSGVQILVFLSALQSISPSIFEASKIEGATRWEEFWKITFPILTPAILINTIYTVVNSFTNPTYGLLSYINTQAFSFNRMGYASALSWIYFVIVFVFLGIIYVVFSKRITYLD